MEAVWVEANIVTSEVSTEDFMAARDGIRGRVRSFEMHSGPVRIKPKLLQRGGFTK